MLYYALVFFVVALIAGALGFFGIASDAAWIAKILFFAFLIAPLRQSSCPPARRHRVGGRA